MGVQETLIKKKKKKKEEENADVKHQFKQSIQTVT